MPRVEVDQVRCKGCGLCAESCPKKVIEIEDTLNASGYRVASFLEREKDGCTGCAICALMCPEVAIRVYRGSKGETEQLVYDRPRSMADIVTSYCPGCSHGIVHRLIAEVIDELGIREKAIGVTSIGCAIFIYKYLDIDYCEGAHGRAPAVAAGIKRVHPDAVVFTYQGDGDIAAIGTSEIVHAAARGENLTVVFVNNGNYGMTGGQMAPTTLMGQVTTTTPRGRNSSHGYPVDVCKLLATLSGTAYVARGACNNVKNVNTLKRYIRKAFQNQVAGRGLSLVECLAACPQNWGLKPGEALARIERDMIPAFPLGEIFCREQGGAA